MFDTCAQFVSHAKVGHSFYVPGEHDIFSDDGKLFLDRYGKGTRGSGWYSINYRGVHFVGMINVMNPKAGGQNTLSWKHAEKSCVFSERDAGLFWAPEMRWQINLSRNRTLDAVDPAGSSGKKKAIRAIEHRASWIAG